MCRRSRSKRVPMSQNSIQNEAHVARSLNKYPNIDASTNPTDDVSEYGSEDESVCPLKKLGLNWSGKMEPVFQLIHLKYHK